MQYARVWAVILSLTVQVGFDVGPACLGAATNSASYTTGDVT